MGNVNRMFEVGSPARPNTNRVHAKYVLVKSLKPKVLWLEASSCHGSRDLTFRTAPNFLWELVADCGIIWSRGGLVLRIYFLCGFIVFVTVDMNF